jgi:hypothetical protein
MTFEEIDTLIEIEFKNHFSDVERRDYRKLEAQNPKDFKGYGAKSGLMFLAEAGDGYVDANLLEKTIKLKYRDGMEDEPIYAEFKWQDFTPAHLTMFIDLIDEHLNMIEKWENKVEKFRRNELPKEYLRMGKLDEITKI